MIVTKEIAVVIRGQTAATLEYQIHKQNKQITEITLIWFEVALSLRGQKMGRYLFGEALRQLPAGDYVLSLSVDKENLAALRIYVAYGFTYLKDDPMLYNHQVMRRDN